MDRFRDRGDAGRRLAGLLSHLAEREPAVLALPRGGVPVAFEVAEHLEAPLDVLPVRKLGVPGHEELAFGAIASGGRVLNREVVAALQLSDDAIEQVAAREQAELERRERAYRGDRPALQVRGRTVIVIDDGIATGATIRAGVKVLAGREPAAIVIATPVAPAPTCSELERIVDEVFCVMKPRDLRAIGLWYEDFAQTSDLEVRGLLDRAARARASA